MQKVVFVLNFNLPCFCFVLSKKKKKRHMHAVHVQIAQRNTIFCSLTIIYVRAVRT